MIKGAKFAAVLLALSCVACEDGVAPPEPGTALINLVTQATDAGAVLVTLTGPGITEVKPANSGYEVFWRIASENEMRVLVLGSLTSGPLLTAEVADVGRLENYTTTLVEIAGRDGAIRAQEGGYALAVSRLSAR